jgi:hypothetical protein
LPFTIPQDETASTELLLNNLILMKKFQFKNNSFTFMSIFDAKNFSVLCEFTSDQIRKVLKVKQFWLNRYETKSNYYNNINDPIDCETTATKNDDFSQFDFQSTDDDDDDQNNNKNENFYQFLSQNTILDDELRGECKLITTQKVRYQFLFHIYLKTKINHFNFIN